MVRLRGRGRTHRARGSVVNKLLVNKLLPNGYCVQFHRPRKRNGVRPPTRFLVLGRKPSQRGIRPIVCAGDVFADRVDVDSGVMGAELREYVLRAFEPWGQGQA